MKTLETRIANIEARFSPETEGPYIMYVVHETDSELERDTLREKAIADYEYKHGVEVDPDNLNFICCEIVSPKR
ncbi:MAG: hypothetical protein NTZ35_02090 [Ignavibacteriales bacterium]|nr:hypothetical protein [Ignavibacteriales bacterium]